MEHEILDLIDRYWKFDDDQTPVSNWHDKQALLEAVRKALHIHDVSISLERAKKYAKHQHFLGTQGKDLVEFEDWAAKD